MMNRADRKFLCAFFIITNNAGDSTVDITKFENVKRREEELEALANELKDASVTEYNESLKELLEIIIVLRLVI